MRARNGEGASMLSPQELERYAHHIVLHEIGGPGQQALKRARVLVIGDGGLGAPALLYLAAAGVGTLALIAGYDVVADGSDNFATRYLVADACFFARKPLVTAAVGIFDGTLTTLRAHERNADGTPNPTYRCLFPEPPPPGTVPTCAEAGILGALTGVLGSLMA